MRNDVDALAVRFGGYVLAEFEGSFFYTAQRWDRGDYDFNAVCAHGVCDAAPVVDAWEEGTCESELVEA